jgi:hypothetical protein
LYIKKKKFKVIKETVATCWPTVDYFENVLLVITIPAEFSETAKAIMRTCAFDAGLIKRKYSTNLQFTTERKDFSDLYSILLK